MQGNGFKIEKYIPIVRNVAKGIWYKYNLDFAVGKDDLIQEGLIYLWKCEKKYRNKRLDISFTRYIVGEVRSHLLDYLKLKTFPNYFRERGKFIISFEDILGINDGGVLEQKIQSKILIEEIAECINRSNFSEENKTVFLEYIISRRGRTKVLAKKFNIAESSVSNIINRIRKHIKKELKLN